MKHYHVIHTTQEFSHLAEEWNTLLKNSASHVPFLRHEFLSTWWETLGGGEWSSGELCITTAYSEEGRLTGIAPLFYTKNRVGQPALLFLGSIEISDFLDFIAPPQEMPSFLEGLLPFLASADLPAWQILDLYNILENSASLPALQSAAEACGWEYHQEILSRSPCIPLPSDWETYLASLDKKQRHEIRRKMRRLESQEIPPRWYVVQDPDSLDEEIEAFFDLMSQDSEKERFLTPQMRTQMRTAMWAAFRAGWLQLAVIEVDGQRAAAYLNFDYGNQIWSYNSGLNFELAALSPGWVLLSYLLQWAIEHGRAGFDFMRGEEEYKYRFGATDRYVMHATVRR